MLGAASDDEGIAKSRKENRRETWAPGLAGIPPSFYILGHHVLHPWLPYAVNDRAFLSVKLQSSWVSVTAASDLDSSITMWQVLLN